MPNAWSSKVAASSNGIYSHVFMQTVCGCLQLCLLVSERRNTWKNEKWNVPQFNVSRMPPRVPHLASVEHPKQKHSCCSSRWLLWPGSFKVKDIGSSFLHEYWFLKTLTGRKKFRKVVMNIKVWSWNLLLINQNMSLVRDARWDRTQAVLCLIRLPEYLITMSVKDADRLFWLNVTQAPPNAPRRAAVPRSSSRPSVGPIYTFHHRRIKHDIIGARVAGCHSDRQQWCCHG